MVSKFQVAANQSAAREAQLLRKMMVTGIRDGAPGGQKFLPLKASTLAVKKRGGSKPLIATGGLRNSITAKKIGGGVIDSWFVGVLRSANSGAANLAEVHEFGATMVIPLTKKSRAFLAAKFGASGGSGSGAGKTGIIIVRVPARPFVRPTAEAYAQPKDVKKRFEQNMAFLMGGMLGKV